MKGIILLIERVIFLKLTVRKIVMAGILGAIAILLGLPIFGSLPIGFIPVPNISGHATIMHIPAILGGVLEGPIVGILVGGIFGFASFYMATTISPNPYFSDLFVAILPRLFIGLVAYLIYSTTKKINKSLALVLAGIMGSLTNTFFVLGMIHLTGKGNFWVFLISVLPQAIIEAIIAAIITLIIGNAIDIYRGARGVRAKSTE